MQLFLSFIILLFYTGCFSHHKHIGTKIPKVVYSSSDLNITHQALVVGTNDYKGNMYDLNGILHDVSNMSSYLSKIGFKVKLLDGKKSMDIENALIEFSHTLTKDDVFILYFSGHGSSTIDRSGDEKDGKDELIVVSDGIKNYYILDDNLEKMLNSIKANKLIIIDSCNSGSVNRDYYAQNSDKQIKFIPAPDGVGDSSFSQKAFFKSAQVNHSDYLFFSSCRDNEKSFTTSNGSLFTNALLSDINLDLSLNVLQQKVTNNLDNIFHPVIDSSREELKNIPLKDFLKIQVKVF